LVNCGNFNFIQTGLWIFCCGHCKFLEHVWLIDIQEVAEPQTENIIGGSRYRMSVEIKENSEILLLTMLPLELGNNQIQLNFTIMIKQGESFP